MHTIYHFSRPGSAGDDYVVISTTGVDAVKAKHGRDDYCLDRCIPVAAEADRSATLLPLDIILRAELTLNPEPRTEEKRRCTR